MDLILLLYRLSVGLFFAISGAHKLFNAARHRSLVATLVASHIPLLNFNQWFVPCVELSAGLGVMTGTLTPLAALGLSAICLVALATNAKKLIAAMQPLDKSDAFDDLLYLPESLLLLLLLPLLTYGGGAFSIDHLATEYLK